MAKSKKNQPTFEEALATAEKNITALEKGEMGLEDALKTYEAGISALRAATAIINQAETKIKALNADANGEPVEEDFMEIAENQEDNEG